jgi:hypothetical protein
MEPPKADKENNQANCQKAHRAFHWEECNCNPRDDDQKNDENWTHGSPWTCHPNKTRNLSTYLPGGRILSPCHIPTTR